jgi:hypothetical protein
MPLQDQESCIWHHREIQGEVHGERILLERENGL